MYTTEDRDFSRELIAAIYARVSTKAQSKESISLDDQVKQMLGYAQRHQVTVPEEYVFQDTYSGLKAERPEYEKIRHLIRERKIDVLIIYSSDRHTREEIHGAIFRNELRRSKVQLHNVSRGGQVDIYTSDGEFVNRMEDLFNWRWAMQIRKNTMERRTAYLKEGIPSGSGATPYGYKREGRGKSGRWVIEPEQAQVILRIFSWYVAGVSVSEICNRLYGTPRGNDLKQRNQTHQRGYGEWTTGQIYRILKNTSYIGTYYAHQREVVDEEVIARPQEEWIAIPVPPIVTQEIWDAAQERLHVNKQERGAQPKYDCLIRRLTKCQCDYSVTTESTVTRGKRYHYYKCVSHKANVTVRTKCGLPQFPVHLVDNAVWAFTVKFLNEPRAVISAMKESQQEQQKAQQHIITKIEELDQMISESTEHLDKLVKEFSRATGLLFDAMKREADQIVTHIEGLKREKAKIQAKLSTVMISDEDIREIERFAREVRPRLPYATFADKRDIIEVLRFTFTLSMDEGERVVLIHLNTKHFRVPINDSIDDFMLGLNPSSSRTASYTSASQRPCGAAYRPWSRAASSCGPASSCPASRRPARRRCPRARPARPWSSHSKWSSWPSRRAA
jgi:site-specific DNA recombinase